MNQHSLLTGGCSFVHPLIALIPTTEALLILQQKPEEGVAVCADVSKPVAVRKLDAILSIFICSLTSIEQNDFLSS